jgi:DNA-directed RNA polymerase subunit K/omega
VPTVSPLALPRDVSIQTIPVKRPTELAAFEFAVLAGLRAGQLVRGCTPRVTSAHKVTVTAQLEVAAGKVVRQINGEPGAIRFP